MTDTIPPDLAAAAQRAGIIDPADLAVFDLSEHPRDAAGRLLSPDAVVEQLKAAKPHLFGTMARDMTAAEAAAFIRELERKAAAEVELPTPSKRAREMSQEEQAEYLRVFAKKYPDQSRFLSIPRRSPYKA
jgi:Mg/Co/Ni transporter MgtE